MYLGFYRDLKWGKLKLKALKKNFKNQLVNSYVDDNANKDDNYKKKKNTI